MILLSKVFPTLDCAACITMPKVSEIARHPNITIFTESEVSHIDKKSANNFVAQITKKPRYGYGQYKNVITSMQMEREIAPTRPYKIFSVQETEKYPIKSPTYFVPVLATTRLEILFARKFAVCIQ